MSDCVVCIGIPSVQSWLNRVIWQGFQSCWNTTLICYMWLADQKTSKCTNEGLSTNFNPVPTPTWERGSTHLCSAGPSSGSRTKRGGRKGQRVSPLCRPHLQPEQCKTCHQGSTGIPNCVLASCSTYYNWFYKWKRQHVVMTFPISNFGSDWHVIASIVSPTERLLKITTNY